MSGRLGEKKDSPVRILLIGPLPPPVGGATRLFSYLAEDLTNHPACCCTVVDISRPPGRNRMLWNLMKAMEVLWKTVLLGARVDVISFHANERGRVYFGPLVFLASRVLRKPLVVRSFGGVFHKAFRDLPPLQRCIVLRTYLRADRCLFETKLHVRYFSLACGSKAAWFSNYTKAGGFGTGGVTIIAREQCRRLVFLGRVVPEKGIEALYEIGSSLPEGVTIDIYGPLDGRYSVDELAGRGGGRVRYRGFLDPQGVIECLREHDALVLPTYHRGEGYPGVVLEAFAQGLPVIVTSLQSIREIVDASCGILIPQRDSKALLEAMETLVEDDGLYQELCRGAWERGRQYDASSRTEQFIDLCRDVVSGS